jgi:hypothetical protein
MPEPGASASRPPLLVRSVITPYRYRTAVVFILIALIPFGLIAAGIAGPGSIILVSAILIALSLLSAANAFLGYPRLRLSGQQLTLIASPFRERRMDLGSYGQAYAVHHIVRGFLQTALAFRTLADEAAHRDKEKYPQAPEYEEAAMKLSLMHLVGNDLDKAEALAKEINAHRGM